MSKHFVVKVLQTSESSTYMYKLYYFGIHLKVSTPPFFSQYLDPQVLIQFKEPNSEQGTIYNQIWQVIYSRNPEWVT